MCGAPQVCQTTGGCQYCQKLDPSVPVGCRWVFADSGTDLYRDTELFSWCGDTHVSLPVHWLQRVEYLCLNPSPWFQRSIRLCSSLLGALLTSHSFSPPHSSVDLGIHGGLVKNKGANCIPNTPPHFRSYKLPQESNDVFCSCIVMSSPELLDSAF